MMAYPSYRRKDLLPYRSENGPHDSVFDTFLQPDVQQTIFLCGDTHVAHSWDLTIAHTIV